jgi:GNAT superfamily N-acetyltransferase
MSSRTTLSIAPALLDDHDFLVAANLAMAWETEARRLPAERLAAGVLAALTDPARGRYLIARDQGRQVGCLLVTYEWSDWRNAMFWWIQSVYVVPEARRGGVFRALYRATEAQAQDEGACGLRLYVEHANETAQRTYRELGMAPCHYHMYERSFVE